MPAQREKVVGWVNFISFEHVGDDGTEAVLEFAKGVSGMGLRHELNVTVTEHHPGDDGCVFDVGVFQESRLDITELHSHATNLHLPVNPTEELDLTVFKIPAAVAGQIVAAHPRDDLRTRRGVDPNTLSTTPSVLRQSSDPAYTV